MIFYGLNCREEDVPIIKEVCKEDIYQREAQVQKGDVVVDAGAQIGSFSLMVVDKARRIISFEPEPENFKLLRVNTAPHMNIEAHNKALWSSSGRMKLHHNQINVGGHNLQLSALLLEGVCDYTLDVDVTTLDEAVNERVDFIKLDVEGAEAEVLKGASKTLAAYHPVIVLEAHPIEPLEPWWRNLLGVMTPFGYEVKGFSFNEQLWCRRIITARVP